MNIQANVQLYACIGKYELLQLLGGKTAEVYRARDRHLGRTVAFKILSPAGLADRETKARFLAEAKMASSLVHENIVGFYDYGEVEGRPFLVTEYFEGETLRDAIHRGHIGPLSDKLRIARQIASALAYVNSKGIVHRDVKPDNVRVDARGTAKLIDFGVAKSDEFSLTGAGFTVGTPYYMAPEQIRGRKPTHLVDVYAFGVLLFELITGIRPFEGRTVGEIFDLILHQPLDIEPLTRLAVPPSLCELIRSATDKDPTKRPRDFGAVGVKIDEILGT